MIILCVTVVEKHDSILHIQTSENILKATMFLVVHPLFHEHLFKSHQASGNKCVMVSNMTMTIVTCYWLYSDFYFLLWDKIHMPYRSRRIFWGTVGNVLSKLNLGIHLSCVLFPLATECECGDSSSRRWSVCVLPSSNKHLILSLMNLSLLSFFWVLCLFVLAP